MYYYMDCGNLNEASRVQAELSPSTRKDILSNYLGYLLALRLHDENAGQYRQCDRFLLLTLNS